MPSSLAGARKCFNKPLTEASVGLGAPATLAAEDRGTQSPGRHLERLRERHNDLSPLQQAVLEVWRTNPGKQAFLPLRRNLPG